MLCFWQVHAFCSLHPAKTHSINLFQERFRPPPPAPSQTGFLSAYLLRQSLILSVSVGECCLSGRVVKWSHMVCAVLCLILVIRWQVFCCLLALRNPIPVPAIFTTCYPERSRSLASFQPSELLRLRSQGPLPGAHHIVCWMCWKRWKEQFDFQILGWVCFYNCWCCRRLTCQLGAHSIHQQTRLTLTPENVTCDGTFLKRCPWVHSFQSHMHTRQIAPGVSNVKRREVRRPEKHSEPPGSVDLLSADCAATVWLFEYWWCP